MNKTVYVLYHYSSSNEDLILFDGYTFDKDFAAEWMHKNRVECPKIVYDFDELEEVR